MSMAMDWAYVDVMVRCPHALGHIVYLDFKKKEKRRGKKATTTGKKKQPGSAWRLTFLTMFLPCFELGMGNICL